MTAGRERTAGNDAATVTGQPPIGGATSDRDNWQALQAHLCGRTRRHWAALQKLRGEEADQELIAAQLKAFADDADALWRLSERLEREVDTAFASRARRVPLCAGTSAARDELRRQGNKRTT